ncbi:MAG: caspase family protein [Labilithrix sp.]|nr:caspase family protein [Labilithrix sp.]MCW5813467.1 caspase family protein [Labilithrix sp.]
MRALLLLLTALLTACAGHRHPVRPPPPREAVPQDEPDVPVPNDGVRTVRASGHGATITTIDVSRDRRWVATGDEHGVVKLWQAEPLRELATSLVPGSVAGVLVTSEGEAFVWTKEGRATRWSPRSNEGHRELAATGVRAVAIADDGAIAIVSDRVRVERESDPLPEGLGDVVAARFDDAGGLVVLGSMAMVRVRDARGAPAFDDTVVNGFWSKALSGDGATIAGKSATSIETWRKGDETRRPHAAAGSTLDAMALSRDGRWLLVQPPIGKHDSRVIEVATSHASSAGAFEFDQAWLDDERIVASKGEDLFSVDRRTGVVFAPARSATVSALAVTPDGKRLVASGAAVHVWSLDGGTKVVDVPRADGAGGMSLSPSGELALRPNRLGGILLHRVSTGAALDGPSFTHEVGAVSFLRDGTTFAIATRDAIALRTPAKDEEERLLPLKAIALGTALAVRADDRVAAVGGESTRDEPILALRALDGDGERILARGPGATAAVAFAPAGALLASGHRDGTIRLWDTTGDAPIRTIDAGAPVLSLAFRSDGKVIAAGARDGKARVFDVATGARLLETAPVPSWANAVAFLPDGRVVSGHDDGGVRLWDPRGALAAELATVGAHDWLVLGADGRFESRSARAERMIVYGVKDGAAAPWDAWADTRRRRGVLGRAVDGRAPPAEAPSAIVQGWPDSRFESLAFDPTSATLATVQREGVLLFDVATGLLTARLPGKDRAAFSPDGATIATASDESLFLSARTGERIAERPLGGHGRRPLSWSDPRHVVVHGGRSLSVLEDVGERASTLPAKVISDLLAVAGDVVVGARRSPLLSFEKDGKDHTGMLQVFDLRAAAPRELRCTSRAIVAVAAAQRGELAACADDRGLVVVVDVATGARTRWRPLVYGGAWGTEGHVEAIALHPTRRIVAAATTDGLFVHDLDAGATTRLEPRATQALAFSPDGALLASGRSGELALWETGGWQNVRDLRSRTTNIVSLATDPRAPRMFVASVDATSRGGQDLVWDARDGGGERKIRPPMGASASAGSFAPDRDVLVTSRYREIDAAEGAARKELWRVTKANGPFGLLQHVEHADRGSAIVTLDGHAAIVAHEAATGAERWRVPLQGDHVFAMAVSPDGSRVAVSSQRDERSVEVFATKDGARVAALDASGRFLRPIAFASDRVLVTSDGTHVVAWDLATKRVLTTLSGFPGFAAVAASPRQKLLAVGDEAGHVTLFDTETWRERGHADLHAHAPSKLGFFGDGRTLVWLDTDGSGRLLDTASGVVTTFAALPSGGLVLVADTGAYLAPRDAAGALGFRWGDRVYPFEQFDALYNNPAGALARVGYAPKDVVDAYDAARRERLRKLGVAPDRAASLVRGEVPTVTVAGVTPVAKDKTLRLRVSASDRTKKLHRLHVIDNGVPLFGAGGKALTPAPRVEEEVAIELVPGSNKLQVSVENELGVLSLEATAVTTYVGAAPKPVLHVYAIGVTEYARPELAGLRYPAKDARDFASAFKPGPSFAGVRTTELTNAKATRAAILALRSEIEKTKAEDVVVLYASGHGVLDRSGGYFFAPHDADVADVQRTAVSYAAIEGLLDGVPARKKLLVMDSCHAGELDAAEAAEITKSGRVKVTSPTPASRTTRAAQPRDFFADLRRGTGAHVLASSAGAEYSLEDPEWKNSVFTYALLQGLRERKADAGEDGELKVSELRAYVRKTVAELTAGHQTPNARRENLEADFDLTPDAPRRAKFEHEQCALDATRTTYTCGAFTLIVKPIPTTDPIARARGLVSAEQTQASGPNLRWRWTLSALPIGALVPTTSLHAHFIAVDAAGEEVLGGVVAVMPDDLGGRRSVRCTVEDALPEAIARCERAIEALKGKPLPAVAPP